MGFFPAIIHFKIVLEQTWISDGQILTSAGAGAPPAFEDAAAGVGGASGVDFNDSVKARFGANFLRDNTEWLE